jgi:hypothetical protein
VDRRFINSYYNLKLNVEPKDIVRNPPALHSLKFDSETLSPTNDHKDSSQMDPEVFKSMTIPDWKDPNGIRLNKSSQNNSQRLFLSQGSDFFSNTFKNAKKFLSHKEIDETNSQEEEEEEEKEVNFFPTQNPEGNESDRRLNFEGESKNERTFKLKGDIKKIPGKAKTNERYQKYEGHSKENTVKSKKVIVSDSLLRKTLESQNEIWAKYNIEKDPEKVLAILKSIRHNIFQRQDGGLGEATCKTLFRDIVDRCDQSKGWYIVFNLIYF